MASRTRSRWASIALIGLVGLALTACTSDADDTEAASAKTRSVTDGNGASVQVPEAPARIVTLSEPTLDGALALGATVVGTTSGRGQAGAPAYLADKAADIPVVASVSGPDVEKILALSPDLILTDGTVSADDAVMKQLGEVATTVYVSKTGADWETAFTALGSVLGKDAEAKQVLAGYDAKVAEVKGKLGDQADASVSIVRWGAQQPSMLLKELPPGKVMTDLGLERPAAQDKEGEGHSQPVSLENLDQLDADWLFFGTLGGATSPQGGNSGTTAGVDASRKLLEENAVKTAGFTALAAYRAKHVVPVDGSAWCSSGGPLAVTTILDETAAALTGGTA